MSAPPVSWNPSSPLANAPPAQLGSDLDSIFANHAPRAGWKCLAEGTIAVALIDVTRWGPWFVNASRLLSADELARVQTRRIPSDRNALALAYALHRLLLAHVLGLPPAYVPLSRDDLGCPRLAGDIAYTSLSHSEGLIALAVTVSGPVGVDIEPSTRAAVMPEIIRSLCHSTEIAQLAKLDESERAAAMLALWVRKEALLKMAGIGLAVPMETFVAPDSPSLMLPALFSTSVQVRMLAAGDQCVAAVAGSMGVAIDSHWLPPPARLAPL